MIASVVLTTLTSVRACTQFVHGERQCLVGLDAQGAKAHGTSNKVLHDALNGLYLVDRCWLGSLLELKEIADEDRALLLVDNLGPSLESIIIAFPRSQLQLSNRLWVPGVLDAVLAPCKETLILKHGLLLGLLVQADGIAGNLLQAYTTDGAHLCAEISSQQVLAQTDALKNLGATIAADGRDTHLRHDFLQALIHCLDIILLGSSVLLLNLVMLHQIVEDGECHVWAEGAGTIAQQQGGVHGLANLTALHN